MSPKLLKCSILLLVGTCLASTAQAGLSLEIAGQPATAEGEVTLFQYWPGTDPGSDPRVEIQTFFADLRCSGLAAFDPDSTSSQFALELDQIIKGDIAEPEAKYDLSGAESITYTPDTGVISVNFATLPMADCMHEIPAVGTIEPDGSANPGAVWLDIFEPLFVVDYELPEGSGFDFQIQVNNNSPIQPLRDIQVNFSASVDEGAQWYEPSTADVQPGADPDSWVWTIPLLWPAGAMDDQAKLDISTDPAVGVGVDAIASLTRSSYPDTAPELITVINTSTSR